MTPAPFLDLLPGTETAIAPQTIDCAASLDPDFPGCHATHHQVDSGPVPLQVHFPIFSCGGVTAQIGLIGSVGAFGAFT